MTRLLTLPALLAAAVFSALVIIPSLPITRTGTRDFVLETHIAASAEGTAKVYLDFGRGYNEADSAELPLARSDRPQACRFAIPSGRLLSVRLDVLDRAGVAILAPPLRILSPHGRVIADVPLSGVEPLNQIESLALSEGALRIATTTGADDPQLRVSFTPAASVHLSAADLFAAGWRRALLVFAGWAAVLFALDRFPRLRRALRDALARRVARPAPAVMWLAAVATVASAYPVVFLGKSYVSPNFGTHLLYERHPTLPGHRESATATANGSDVGAAMWQHVPYSFMQRRALAEGELPLWNRYTVGGIPLLGQAQSMFGDPLHFVVLLCDGAAWAWDLKFIVSKWLFAAGVGLLALAVVGHTGAAVLVAGAAPFVGFYLYRVNHPAVFALGYAPWVLYCWIRVARAGAVRPAAGWLGGLLVANVALMNSGTVKEAYVLLAAMNVTGAAALLAGMEPWPRRLAKLAGAAWVGGLLLLVTMPVWRTFLDTLPHAYTSANQPFANQVQPALLLGAFDELFFRPLSAGEIVFNPSANFVVLLGLAYFVATIRVQLAHRERLAIAGCAAFFMAVVFGVVPPTWVTRVPLLGMVWHVDNCLLAALLVLWPVLAAEGFRTAAARLGSSEGRGDLLVAGGLVLLIVAAWIGFGQAAHRQSYGPGTTLTLLNYGQVIPVSPFVWAHLGLMLLAALAVALLARRALRRGAVGPAGGITLTLCALVLLWRHGAHHPALGFETYLVQPPARADFHAKSDAIEDVRARHAAQPGRVLGLQANLVPGWNAAYGLETIHGADAIQNRPLRELIDVSPVRWNSGWSVYVTPSDLPRARPFLDALNVRYYVTLPSALPVDAGLTLVKRADLDVYESRTAWPRAFFTDTVSTYATPAELVAKFVAPGVRPFAAIRREDAADPALTKVSRETASAALTPATDFTLTSNTTSFRVQASGPGLVVLAEAWWPDSFRATLNGRRVPVLRVNHAFKGLAVEAAGDYEVTFAYRPRNFGRSLLLHGVGVLLAVVSFAAAWVWGGKIRARATPAESASAAVR